jgi:hypothetical protein
MTFIEVVLKKEKIHWKRMRNLMKELNRLAKVIGPIIGILIIFPIVIITHYAFMLMHSSFELYLYLFNRPGFYANLVKLQATLVVPESNK